MTENDINKPRILMFCDSFYPMVGGAERQMEKLTRELLWKGYKVEVLTPQHKKEWALKEEINGVIINRFPYRNLSKLIPGLRGIGIPNTVYLAWQTKQAVARIMNRFDILHAHIATPMVAFAMSQAHAMKKKVICLLASSGTLFDLTMMRKTNFFGSCIVRRLRSRMDHWIAISEQVHQDIISEGVDESRISRIPNGVEIPADFRSHSATVGRFLYLGRLSSTAQRDIPTLFQAFDDLLQKYPDCELRMVGGGDLEGEARMLLDTFPRARKRTEMVGFCDPRPWLEWAEVLVQPSIAEGMSNTLLEAMSYGIACIANDIPPNREVLDGDNTGILVPIGDRQALTAAMICLVASPEKRDHLGNSARARVEKVYSMDKIVERYISLYHRLGKCTCF